MIHACNKAALYARFSSDNQRSESIDAQIRAMEAYCAQRKIEIVDTYIDEARSATTDRRPSFQRLIADSARGIFNILLVHKLDRFARNRYDSAVYKRELKKNGVTVYSVLENLDDSPESIMMESVLEGMSEYYSQNLAREVMKGMRETALQCKHTGGKPPLGYDVDPVSRRLVVNPEEAETVKLIFSMYAEGYGYDRILDALHELKCKTKNGNDFMKNSLYGILNNQKYRGIYIFNRSAAKSISGTRNTHLSKPDGEIIAIDGGCPRLIEEGTFSKVQRRMEENRHKGARNNAKTNYLLSGKVFCKECGRTMTGNSRVGGRNKARYISYRCPANKHSCENREINQSYLERYVVALLEKRIFNVPAMRSIARKIEHMAGKQESVVMAERAKVQAELDKITNAISNITDVIMSGIQSCALTSKLAELEHEKALLETSLSKLGNRNGASQEITVDPLLIPQQYKELRESPSSPAYKSFIQSFIDRIEIGKYALTVTLKTGLDIFPALDLPVLVRRQEVYEGKSSS